MAGSSETKKNKYTNLAVLQPEDGGAGTLGRRRSGRVGRTLHGAVAASHGRQRRIQLLTHAPGTLLPTPPHARTAESRSVNECLRGGGQRSNGLVAILSVVQRA